jgi:hypothetical protein
MACYVCVYQSGAVPLSGVSAPAGAVLGDPLATCTQCGVWACAFHGKRISLFLCAICRAAKAVQHALAPSTTAAADTAAPAAAAYAAEIGRAAGGDARHTVELALRRVLPARMLTFVEGSGPDYVNGLDEVLRERTGTTSFPATSRLRMFGLEDLDDEPVDEEVSVDAIGAAVRATFAGAPLDPRPDAVEVITGALLESMAVANSTPLPGRGPTVVNPAEAVVVAPWEVAHPILLDPVLWMIATAVSDVRQ